MYWSSQLRGCSFQKARNFTASSHQNAGFSIWVFKKFSVGDTPGPSQREEVTPSRTQHPARPLAGRGAQAPRCWDPNLGPPSTFQPWLQCTPIEGIVPLLSVLLSNYVSSSWMDEDSVGIVLSTNISCQPSSPHMLLIYCWVLKCFSLL